MRNTKHQTPNTKKLPTDKHQLAPTSCGWPDLSDCAGPGNGALALHDASETQPGRHPFDMEERTAVFGENIVRFSKRIPRHPTNDRLIDQITGAGTSVGANFCEANDCVSKKDFRYCVKRCIKEAKETRFFLRMVAASEPSLAEGARSLYREATELIKILAAMYSK